MQVCQLVKQSRSYLSSIEVKGSFSMFTLRTTFKYEPAAERSGKCELHISASCPSLILPHSAVRLWKWSKLIITNCFSWSLHKQT